MTHDKNNYEGDIMSDNQIKQMVSRFLTWQLPDDFNPDAGIKYEKLSPYYGVPIGTNLLNATQAEQMIRYITDGVFDDTQPE